MSMVRSITKGATTVDLTASPYTFMEEPDFGGVTHSASVYRNVRGDLPGFGRSDLSSPRSVPFQIIVTGTNADTCAAYVSALIDVLPDDDTPSTITIGANGSAYTGTITARRIDGLISKPYSLYEYHQFRATVSFSLLCDPYVEAATETLYSASGIDAPTMLSLSAQTGQFATPLDLLLDAGALTLASCYIGHTTDETAVIADYVKPLAAATWTAIGGASGGAATTDAAGYPDGAGNTVYATTDDEGYVTAIDVTALSGDFAVFANVKYTTGSTGAYVKQEFGDWTLVTTAALKLLYLGTVSLPTQAVRGAITSTLDISIKGNDTNGVAINYVALLPVSRGVTGYTSATHVHTLRWEDGTLYADDAVNLASVYGSCATLRTLRGQLVILGENATAAYTTHLHATLAAMPRWEQFPS